MDFTKALIPKDNYIRYTQVSVGSSSSPSDCTDYGLIFLKTNSTMTAHIRCRPGTWVICQTSSLSNSINCSVYTDYSNYDNVSFTFNVGGQGLEHWYIGGNYALCTFAYSKGTFGTNMGLIKNYTR